MPSRRSLAVNERARENKQKPCDVEGCFRKRHFLSTQCRRHGVKVTRHGHIRGRAIEKTEWLPYYEEVHALLIKNAGHESIPAAEETMARILTPGPERKPKRNGPGADEYHLQVQLTRLQRASVSLETPGRRGFSPRIALETACAVWLLSQEQPGTLPDDERLTHAIANSVYKLAPFAQTFHYDPVKRRSLASSKWPGAGACRLLGSRIRTLLGRFFWNVKTALEAQKQAINEERAKVRTPLSAIGPYRPAPLPKRYDRPVYHTLADLEAIRKWERLVPLWEASEASSENLVRGLASSPLTLRSEARSGKETRV